MLQSPFCMPLSTQNFMHYHCWTTLCFCFCHSPQEEGISITSSIASRSPSSFLLLWHSMTSLKYYTCAADRHGSTQTLLHLSFWCACATVNNLEKISITCPSTFPHPTEHWVWCIANERFSEGEDYVMYGPDWFLVDKINECIPKAFLFFKYSFYQRNILNMARNSKVRKFQLL